MRGYADGNFVPDLIEEIHIPSSEDAFQDAVSFLNWMPLVDINNNNQNNMEGKTHADIGFKVIIVDDSHNNPKPRQGTSNKKYTQWGEGNAPPCYTTANIDEGTYFTEASSKLLASVIVVAASVATYYI